MTALPTRCRNTKDALRRPPSDAAVRVRRDRADRSCVFAAARAFGLPPLRAAPLPRLMPEDRELPARSTVVGAWAPTVPPVWRAMGRGRAMFLGRRGAPFPPVAPAGPPPARGTGAA